MADMDIDLKVDVGVLKNQVFVLSELCQKMDTVIEKMIDQHDRHISKVYTDMDNRRVETDSDIKELHARIDTVLDKVQATEIRIMDEIKSLRKEMVEFNTRESEAMEKLLKWKWMIAGGIVAMSWLISHLDLPIISRLLMGPGA